MTITALLLPALLFATLAAAQVGGGSDAPGRVQGIVANQITGEPLRKVQLELRSQDHPESERLTVLSGADGAFSFSNLPSGRYSLSADHFGFEPAEYSAPALGRVLVVSPGLPVQDLQLRLIPLSVLGGVVTDDDGDPLPGVSVELMRPTWASGHRQLVTLNQTTTNDLGEYRLAEVSAGNYYIRAQKQASGNAASQWSGTAYYPNAAMSSAAAPLAVAPGLTLRGINFMIRRSTAVRIAGHVSSGTGPARGATAMLLPADPATSGLHGASTQVAGDGRFVLRGVSPGPYLLSIEQFADNAGERRSARIPLDVRDTNLDGLEIILLPGAALAGHVVFQEKSPSTSIPAGQLKVVLQPSTPLASPGVTGGVVQDNGRFRLTGIRPDLYGVTITGLEPNAWVRSIRLGNTDVTESGLDFTQGVMAGDLSILISDTGGQITGSVETADNRPAADVTVIAIPTGTHTDPSRLYKLTHTPENGRFQLQGLAPGEYQLLAFEQIVDGAYRDPSFIRAFESQGIRVAVAEKSSKSVQLKVIPAAGMTFFR